MYFKYKYIFDSINIMVMLIIIFIMPNLFVNKVYASNNCRIEDWRWYQVDDIIHIDGSATCKTGKVYIRVYDESDNYLGNDWTFIDGYTFSIAIFKINTNVISIKIKYVITN